MGVQSVWRDSASGDVQNHKKRPEGSAAGMTATETCKRVHPITSAHFRLRLESGIVRAAGTTKKRRPCAGSKTGPRATWEQSDSVDDREGKVERNK